MSLSSSYIDYIRRPGGPAGPALSRELQGAGYGVEAALLSSYLEGGTGQTTVELRGSPWSGHRAWLGPYLPDERETGDIWFDPLEVMPMLLIPDEPLPEDVDISPELLARYTLYRGWIAMRPVANWQFNAFLQLAETGPREVQVGPPFRLLDPKRIITGRETDPVTSVTGGEARMYAHWFGKSLPDQYEWQMAARFLSHVEFNALWSGPQKEWAGSYDEGTYLAISPETIEADPDNEDVQTGRHLRMLYGEWEFSREIGLRTHVLAQTGLFGGVFTIPTSLDNVELLDVLDRDV